VTRTGALAVLVSGVAVLGATGCPAKGEAKVDGVLLAQADGVREAPEGPTLAVDEKTIDAAVVPAGATVVRLAIGRKVLWNQVRALMARVSATGARPVLLVGQSYRVREMPLEDEWPGGPALQVMAYIDGKACVQPPGAIEAKCVQSGTKQYIERAFLRELVREQVKAFQIEQVEVELPTTLPWYDVVRTIDGARTCCRQMKAKMRVRLAPAQVDQAGAVDAAAPSGAAPAAGQEAAAEAASDEIEAAAEKAAGAEPAEAAKPADGAEPAAPASN
jgi:hypothetical protein